MMKGSAVTILWALSAFLLLDEVVSRRPRRSRGDFMSRIRRRHHPDPHCDGGPSDPPEQGEVCGSCGGFAGAECNYGLYCKIISGDFGVCLPLRGPGSGTYGQKGGVCGRCRSCTRNRRRCKKGLHCEYNKNGGICIPDKEPVCPPRESDICGSCGGFSGKKCKNGLYCQAIPIDDGICLPTSGPGYGTYGLKGGVCGTCNSCCNSKNDCLPGLQCESNNGNNGICIPNPNDVVVCPPRKADICESCGFFTQTECKLGLYCQPIGADDGICLPNDGPGSGTYGKKGGVCGGCTSSCNSCEDCMPGLHCETNNGNNGICIPNTGSWKCDASKGEQYTDCGTACPRTCGNYTADVACIALCVPGCFCLDGTVRREWDNRCVNPEYCWWK